MQVRNEVAKEKLFTLVLRINFFLKETSIKILVANWNFAGQGGFSQ